MLNGWLDPGDVAALSRQAVDLLDPAAAIGLADETGSRVNSNVGVGMGFNVGGSIWSVTVDVGTSQCVVRVTSAWSPAEALANLIGELAQACGHRFRGRYFPECPGHGHAASLDLGPGEVILRCPDSAEVVEQLVAAR